VQVTVELNRCVADQEPFVVPLGRHGIKCQAQVQWETCAHAERLMCRPVIWVSTALAEFASDTTLDGLQTAMGPPA
jgi:hypothetical protein